jgi:reactive intermediate/imine deaminase
MSDRSEIKCVETPLAAKPQGHYSQAVVHGGLVYVAMQIAIDPEKGPQLGPVDNQARVALSNVEQILKAAGSSMDRVLRVTVYLSDISLWGQVNDVYADYFGDHRPARGVVPCKELHLGLDVAFEVTAAC